MSCILWPVLPQLRMGGGRTLPLSVKNKTYDPKDRKGRSDFHRVPVFVLTSKWATPKWLGSGGSWRPARVCEPIKAARTYLPQRTNEVCSGGHQSRLAFENQAQTLPSLRKTKKHPRDNDNSSTPHVSTHKPSESL